MSRPPLAELEALKADYRASLSRRLAALAQMQAPVCAGQATPEELERFCRELHTLCGSAKTFGFPRVGEAAAAAEAFALAHLRAGAALEPAEKEAFSSLLAALAAAV